MKVTTFSIFRKKIDNGSGNTLDAEIFAYVGMSDDGKDIISWSPTIPSGTKKYSFRLSIIVPEFTSEDVLFVYDTDDIKEAFSYMKDLFELSSDNTSVNVSNIPDLKIAPLTINTSIHN